MSELDPLATFEDELAATRRQLRRLEKLAVSLKRQQHKQPRHLGPLFRLRKVRDRLAECEKMLSTVTIEPASNPGVPAPNSTSTSVSYGATIIHLYRKNGQDSKRGKAGADDQRCETNQAVQSGDGAATAWDKNL